MPRSGELSLASTSGVLFTTYCRYNEAVHQLTRPQDIVWQAASLEGIVVTTVVEAWAANRVCYFIFQCVPTVCAH